MFEQISISRNETKVRRNVLCAFLGQLLAVGVLVVVPMICVQALPVAALESILVAPPPAPPPPPALAPAVASTVRAVPRHFDAGALMEPHSVPEQAPAATIGDLLPVPSTTGVAGGVPGGVADGQFGGVIGGILSAVPAASPPPPPPPPAPKPVGTVATPPPAEQIRVGGEVEAAQLISAPSPSYPPVAKAARVQGVVKLDAVIGKDGRIENLTVVSGSALLIPAAIDAVKHWVYRPTYLNGRAVQVATEIDVRFRLG